MTDPNEVQVSKLAKKMLSRQPKKREDSNLESLERIPTRVPPNAQTTIPASEAGFSLRKKRVHELD
jgi:hypothetical protein